MTLVVLGGGLAQAAITHAITDGTSGAATDNTSVFFPVSNTDLLAPLLAVYEAGQDSWTSIREIDVIPEPSTFVLAAMGLLGLASVAWRRGRK